MKIFQNVTVLIMLVILLAACQSSSDIKEITSNPKIRKEVMNKIANDSSMSKEMIAAMMTTNNGMDMMKNHESMVKMMKNNPGMMHNMMSGMMDMCTNDSTMMADMCKTMMANPQLMDMMQKMKDKNMEMGKMKGMDTIKTNDHKEHH